MRKFLILVDEKTIEVFQEIYLKIWDWTGVTVGVAWFTTVAAICVPGIISGTPFKVIIYCILMTFALRVSLFLHTLQKQSPLAFNIFAESQRASIFRKATTVVIFVGGLMNLPSNPIGFVEFFGLSGLFLSCCMVRDREPPQWGRRLAPSEGGR
jgi:hypothetical protein